MRRLSLALLLLAPLPLAAQSAAPSPHAEAPDSTPPAVFAMARLALAQRYVRPLSMDSLLKATTREALFGPLHDPFTTLLSPAEWAAFQGGIGAAFGGIGTEIVTVGDTTRLAIIMPGGGAAKAGLRDGDRLLAIDGTSFIGKPSSAVTHALRGKLGTPVAVTVHRPGHGTITAQITRGSVQPPLVTPVHLSADGTAYAAIPVFGDGLAERLLTVLDSLQARGMKRLVLDLRGNPGGLVSEAAFVSSFFLPPGSLVFETRGRPGTRSDSLRIPPSVTAPFRTLPLALLVDEGSASASEILAGALQDYRRAVIVGERTFGKGLVQTTMDLADGWHLKLTTNVWATPSGRLLDRGILTGASLDDDSTHAGGVVPDAQVADSLAAADKKASDALAAGDSTNAIALGTALSKALGRLASAPVPPGEAAARAEVPAIRRAVPAPLPAEVTDDFIGRLLYQELVAVESGRSAARLTRLPLDTQYLAAVSALQRVALN